MSSLTNESFVIAGVNGGFGRVLARKLAHEGASVCGVDLQESALEPGICRDYFCSSITQMTRPVADAIKDSDYVLLCVPEEAVLGALPQLSELMRDDAVVMDIASVKTRITRALSSLRSRVGYLSFHPMFGPMDDFSGRAICIIPLRENSRTDNFQALLLRWGAHVTTLTAQQHDSATALVQVLPHAALIAFGETLANSGVPFSTLWSIATPIHRLMLSLLARVVNGEHETYWSIQSVNPGAGTVREDFLEELTDLSSTISHGSSERFSAKLASIGLYLGVSGQTLQALAANCIALAKDCRAEDATG